MAAIKKQLVLKPLKKVPIRSSDFDEEKWLILSNAIEAISSRKACESSKEELYRVGPAFFSLGFLYIVVIRWLKICACKKWDANCMIVFLSLVKISYFLSFLISNHRYTILLINDLIYNELL